MTEQTSRSSGYLDSIPEPIPLSERPGEWPTQLFVHGGRAPVSCRVLLIEQETSQWINVNDSGVLQQLKELNEPLWIQIRGLADPELIKSYLDVLDIEPEFWPLLLTAPQQARIDSFPSAVLGVLHQFSLASNPSHLISEQFTILLAHGFLITIQENPLLEFRELEHWIHSLKSTEDYLDLDNLFHYLIDEILDTHLPMLESVRSYLDELEEAALLRPKPSVLKRAFTLRRNLRKARRQLWPLRDHLIYLLRKSHRLLGPGARQGLHDMADHVNILLEIGDRILHQADAVNDAYMASTGNRMNQIMKTLTIVSTIFAPLTFIAGIYGMNFENMPELKWSFGYAYSLILMSGIAAFQAYFLWRRGWFQDWTGGPDSRSDR